MTSQALLGLRVCLDCGKCTATCPIAAEDGGLSPRRIVRQAANGSTAAAVEAAHSCLTCGLCDERCPVKVPYIQAVRDLRCEAGPSGRPDDSSHCGVFGTLSKIQTTPGLKPNRLDWLTDDLETDPESETLLWVGCIPYFGAYFQDWKDDIHGMAANAVRVMNKMGIKPAISADERCCGHDALWTGDVETFTKLAETNLAWLKESPAKTIVFLCPSCALSFKQDIPERVGAVDKEMLTLGEFLAANPALLPLESGEVTVTFHDPCRQGRHAGIYEEPREVIESLPGVTLTEMDSNRASALCCGGGNWGHCDAVTRRVQARRLKQAEDTGAEIMVTTCPRCLIHLRCAREGTESETPPGLPLVDLGSLVADHLKDGEPQ
jgi:heterodisulfide reductase subunit D